MFFSSYQREVKDYESYISIFNKDLLDLFIMDLSNILPDKDILKNIPKSAKEKAKIINDIMNDKENLIIVYKNLSKMEKEILAEVVYLKKNTNFDIIRFCFKYNYKVREVIEVFHFIKHKLILLFFNPDISDSERFFKEKLLPIIPKPEPYKITYINDDEISNDVRIHETETSAIYDVMNILQLIKAGEIKLTANSPYPNVISIKKIRGILFSGDYYQKEIEENDKNKKSSFDLNMKSIAWVCMFIGGAVVDYLGNEMEFSKEWKEFKGKNDAIEVLKVLFAGWVMNQDYNEILRINNIKARNKYNAFYDINYARTYILETFKFIEPNKWIDINTFIQLIYETGNNFNIIRPYCSDVTINGINISIFDELDRIKMISNQFVKVFLLEYMATLGIIDVGIVLPDKSLEKEITLPLGEKVTYLTKYDGLLYFRINNFGKHIFGFTKKYEPPKKVTISNSFKVLPNMEIVIEGQNINAVLTVKLDKICNKMSDNVFKLDKKKILNFMDNGFSTNDIKEFLSNNCSNNNKEIPKSVIDFLDGIQQKSDKVKIQGKGTVIKCENEQTAMIIANHKKLKEFCIFHKEQYIIFDSNKESVVKKILKELGYIV